MIGRLSRALALTAIATTVVLAPRGSLAAPTGQAPLMSARYTLSVNVDDQHQTVDAQETVEATNLTGTALTSFVFEVIPRRFAGFQLGSVAVDGTRVAPTFDDVVMEVPLHVPVKANGSTRITMSFKETVPPSGSTGYRSGSDVLALGQWFPELSAYRSDGWDRQTFSEVGYPYLFDPADYRVTVRTDPHVIVASTGVVTKHQGGEWDISANGVRGLAMAMSRRYQSRSVNVDGTRITTYSLPEDAATGQAVLEDARASFGWLTRQLGPYGYPDLAIAETPGLTPTDSGEAFPDLIFLTASRQRPSATAGDALTYLVARETARQWFSSIVGSDGARQPWIAEGLTNQWALLFLKDLYPTAYNAQWSQVQADYTRAAATWGHKSLDTTIADYPDQAQYVSLLGNQATIFLERLRDAMGNDAYDTFLRDYVATYRGEITTTSDFLLLAERYAGHDLTDLYKDYFRPESYVQATPTVAPARSVAPTSTATPRPAPVATVIPTATAVPSATVAAPTLAPTVQPTVVSTPAATTASGDLGSVFGLIAISSLVGLALVGTLSFVLLRRQS